MNYSNMLIIKIIHFGGRLYPFLLTFVSFIIYLGTLAPTAVSM